MQATLYMVQKFVSHRSAKSHGVTPIYKHVVQIASVLYECCIVRLREFMDFDQTSATLGAECFYLIVTGISNNYKHKFLAILSEIGKYLYFIPYDQEKIQLNWL